jgi:predicted enzyme related to lactoylglutathione lyase
MSGIEHPPGSMCWVELSTTDPGAAKRFYTELFGWDAHDDPIPGGGVYTMLRLGGGNVGALYGEPEELRARRTPPHWLAYVTVASATEATQRASALGGTIVTAGCEVGDLGTMAALQDPAGATIAVWQPNRAHGADFRDGRPGSACWIELATNDPAAARRFYSGLHGWTAVEQQFGSLPYTQFMLGEEPAAGMYRMPPEMDGVPPSWTVYFSVVDCDRSVEHASRMRATVSVPPTDIPTVGRFAMLTDPQGAAFAVIALDR